MFLGAGVAYHVESKDLIEFRHNLSQHYESLLIPQDRQPFRPHVTIQNKVHPDVAKALLAKLSETFTPFMVKATGLSLWRYLGGPWQALAMYNF